MYLSYKVTNTSLRFGGIIIFKEATGKKIKTWMGLLGVLGFLGFIAFRLKESSFLLFFTFFGFFSFYWWAKIDYQETDERLIENQRKALALAYRISLVIIFISLILINNYKIPVHLALASLTAVIALSVAGTMNLEAYLLYRYERGN